MSHRKGLSRRHFLGASAAVAAPMVVPAAVLGRGSVSPNEKITLGVIGIGPRGTYDLQAMLGLNDVQCVAIADVQASRRKAGKALVDKHYGNSDCKLYGDFRELLDRKDIDTVLVATGDRWHADASMLAAKAGKDVYSEKPCGLTIDLCNRLAATIRDTGRIFQAGTQRRSVPNFQQAIEFAQSGKLGKLKTVYASVYRPTLDASWLSGEPVPPKEICDWNMWLGPAPQRPYNYQYVSGGWRGYNDFDSGARLLDWGAHTVDLCQWANQADGSGPTTFEPSANNIVATYQNGVKLVIDFLDTPFGDRGPNWTTRLGTCPVKFVGENGSIETGDSGETVASTPALEKQLAEAAKRVKGLDVSAHARNFFDSVRSRKPTVANADIMRSSHNVCHAAAMSWILKRKLSWDPAKHEFIGDEEANSMRSRTSRDWESTT